MELFFEFADCLVCVGYLVVDVCDVLTRVLVEVHVLRFECGEPLPLNVSDHWFPPVFLWVVRDPVVGLCGVAALDVRVL